MGKNSLSRKITNAFIITSIIPITFITMFSYVATSNTVKENAETLIGNNVQQIQMSLDMALGSYEDLLLQACVDDEIVELVERINEKEDRVSVELKLKKKLQSMLYAKKNIRSVMVITESGERIFYEGITGSSIRSIVFNLKEQQEEAYKKISETNQTVFFPTEKCREMGDHYLFHIGHRVIDYQNIVKPLGVLIISIDENMLKETCNNDQKNSDTFLVSADGVIISHVNKEYIGEKIISQNNDIEKRKRGYLKFVKENDNRRENEISLNAVYRPELQSDIVYVSDQKSVNHELRNQQKIIFTLMFISILILIGMNQALLHKVMRFINNFIFTMKEAAGGTLSVRTAQDKDTLAEFKPIEQQFNQMLEQLEFSRQKEKEANAKQKDAEIAALEAQINPHFLYNTLDTINWMAINNDEYEISNAISTLAYILRYTIDKSNAIVTVKEETEWLKQYLFLQQIRLQGEFKCSIEVDPDILEWRIHKQLMQPFVENAIIHGFELRKKECILRVNIDRAGNDILIVIWDNGKGIEPELVDAMNGGTFPSATDKNCIGIENSITRINLYYGKRARVSLESEIGRYTKIRIVVPRIAEEI